MQTRCASVFASALGRYGGNYATVAALQTLRVFWAAYAHFGLTICQLQVSSAFLYALLEEKVYREAIERVGNWISS